MPGNRVKVASSIAHLYQRPRVWLEGYHSLGWGATPALITRVTCQNYVYGASLLNLHGLYYTTYGGFWEWAVTIHNPLPDDDTSPPANSSP